MIFLSSRKLLTISVALSIVSIGPANAATYNVERFWSIFNGGSLLSEGFITTIGVFNSVTTPTFSETYTSQDALQFFQTII